MTHFFLVFWLTGAQPAMAPYAPPAPTGSPEEIVTLDACWDAAATLTTNLGYQVTCLVKERADL